VDAQQHRVAIGQQVRGSEAILGTRRHRGFALCVVAIMAVAILYQLLIPPVIGLADNGDFGRTIHHAGLTHVSDAFGDRYFSFINTKFAIRSDPASDLGYLTTEILLVWLARYANAIVSKDGLFDLRVMGVAHTFAVITGLWLIISAVSAHWRHARVPVAILLVLIFTDVSYVAYLNSFYGEAAMLASLPILIATVLMLAANRRPSAWLVIGYFCAALFFACAKPSNSFLGILLALFGVWLFGSHYVGVRRHAVVALALLLCVSSLLYYVSTPRPLSMAAMYDMMFHEILPHSPSPENDLRAFDLDPGLAKYAGTNAWSPDGIFADPNFRTQFFVRVNYPRIVQFYAMRPERAWELTQRGATFVFSARPAVLGNFERTAGLAPGAHTDAFALWSGLRDGLPKTVWLLVGLWLWSIAVSADIYRRAGGDSHQYIAGLNLLCLIMAIMQFGTCILAEGEFDLARHLFLFNLLMDVCLVINVVWITSRVRDWTSVAEKKVVDSDYRWHGLSTDVTKDPAAITAQAGQ